MSKFIFLSDIGKGYYCFLVDDINDDSSFGVVSDSDLIAYNLDVLGENFQQHIQINNLLSDVGLTTVFDLGSFVVVFTVSKSLKEYQMSFFKYREDLDLGGVRKILSKRYSENVWEKWVTVYNSIGNTNPENILPVMIVKPPWIN